MMICPGDFLDELRKRGFDFFCGVPDSLLKAFCACLDDKQDKRSHIITANEGNAVALAAGYHLATGRAGVVYLQNSGIGNAVNPLASLTDPEVYRIPLLLIVGWRGEPGIKDEPQHRKQGRITLRLFETLEIPYEIMGPDSDYAEIIKKAVARIGETNSPSAIIIRKNTFSSYKSAKIAGVKSNMFRETAIRAVLKCSKPDDLLISTTGKTSRELYELRLERDEAMCDFLTVGSMGHTSSIALGIALFKQDKRVICLDGDGSILMHLGSMSVIADLKPGNLVHVLLNNSSHESVGGQPTVAGNIDFKGLSESIGYSGYFSACCEESIKNAMQEIDKTSGPVLFEIIIKPGSREDLSRPESTPEENKRMFMKKAND